MACWARSGVATNATKVVVSARYLGPVALPWAPAASTTASPPPPPADVTVPVAGDGAFNTPIDLTNLKYAVGPGLRWNSPFGPIRVDYGVNPNPTGKEKFGNFQFSMGSAF